MKTSEQINEISKALVKAQSEMGNASKDAKNPFFKSKFADLNAIREAAIPVLNANNIMVLQPMTMIDGRTFVETVLLHSSGQFISSMTEIVVPEAKRSDPQAHGAAQSYSRRYGLQSLVCIGAEDNDGEGAVERKPTTSKITVQGTAGTGVLTLSTAPIASPKEDAVTKQYVDNQSKPIEEVTPKKRFGGGFGSKAITKDEATNTNTKGDLY